MKCLIAFALICLIATTFADDPVCKVFSCGSITQPSEGANICVKRNGAELNADNDYKAATCSKDGEVCSTTDAAWSDPSTAPDKASCAAGTDPTWPPTRKPADGASLAGDYCTQDSHCFKQDGDKIKCDTGSKKCTNPSKIDDACDDIKECNVNQYCKDKKCAAAIAIDKDCTAADPCEYGLMCVASNDALDKFVCTKNGGFDNGKQFKFAAGIPKHFMKFESANAQFTLTGLCKSQIAMILDGGNLQCRNGPVSDSQNVKDLKTDKAGTECKISTTDNADPTKFDEKTAGTVTSKCGFNKDTSAYCNVQFGDKYVTDAIADAQKKAKIPDTGCHPLSGADSEGATACVSAYDTTKDNVFATVTRKVTEAAAESYYLTADNDKCVAEAITQQFWRGTFGNSAMQFGVIGTVSVFAFLLAFIY